MELTSVKTIKELLLKYNAHPSKIMGQNFLIDKSTLNKIIQTADLNTKDTILEIGPGIGTLTEKLAENLSAQAGAGKIIAIEKDKAMAEILKETLKDYKNVEIIKDDALRYNCQLKKYKVVANIPYYLTSSIIRKFLEEENKPETMILMVQKEVAQRICASIPKMSLLAVSVQFYAKTEIVSYVSKENFWPSPKVDSAIIKITPNASGGASGGQTSVKLFFQIVKAGFLQPRKQLRNNLSKLFMEDKKEIYPVKSAKDGSFRFADNSRVQTQNEAVLRKAEQFNRVNLWLLKNKINPMQRAQTLTVQDWINLANNLNN